MNRRALIRDAMQSVRLQLENGEGGALTVGQIFDDLLLALGAVADELEEHHGTLEGQAQALLTIGETLATMGGDS